MFLTEADASILGVVTFAAVTGFTGAARVTAIIELHNAKETAIAENLIFIVDLPYCIAGNEVNRRS